MARPDKSGMIDGYMAVQSVRRNSDRHTDQSQTGVPTHEENTPVKESSKPPSQHTFGHTALPTRHEIRCYACEYQFIVTGSLDKVICPKCKEQLHTGDKTICGPYSGNIQTVGTVTIHNGAKITDSVITASVIRIAGECIKTQLRPGVRVELESGAMIDNATLDDVDVVIRENQQVNLEIPLRCQNLLLSGQLRAEVLAQQSVTLRHSAVFQGKIQAHGLVIEEGASIRADLHITPLKQVK